MSQLFSYLRYPFVAGTLVDTDHTPLQNDPEDVYNLLLDLVLNGELGAVNYFLGGTVTDVVV
jgi:hypothetical protein